MKKIALLLSIIVALSALNVSAQKISTANVPAAVIKTFQEKFAAASKPSWEMETATEYEVNFKLHSENYSARFKADGSWLETEVAIAKSKIPAKVLATLSATYPSYHLNESESAESPQLGNFYALEVTANGKKYDIDILPSGVILSNKDITAKN